MAYLIFLYNTLNQIGKIIKIVLVLYKRIQPETHNITLPQGKSKSQRQTKNEYTTNIVITELSLCLDRVRCGIFVENQLVGTNIVKKLPS